MKISCGTRCEIYEGVLVPEKHVENIPEQVTSEIAESISELIPGDITRIISRGYSEQFLEKFFEKNLEFFFGILPVGLLSEIDEGNSEQNTP